MGDGKRAQRLRNNLPGIGEHRQFPAPGTDHLAVHVNDVAEVDVGLPRVERFLPDAVEADHHLQLGPVALLQCRETQLSGVAGKHDPTGDTDDLAGLGVGGQVRIGPAGSRPACGCGQPRPDRDPDPRQAAAPASPDGSGTARGRRTRCRADQVRSRPASLNERMAAPISAAAVAALADEVIDWRFKGLPASWWGRTPAQICAESPDLFDGGGGIAGSAGGGLPLSGGRPSACCAPRRSPTTSTAMAGWCRDRGVELAPHGKTHMAPQLFARQLDAGACGITAATLSHVRTYRAFGVRDVRAGQRAGRWGRTALAGSRTGRPSRLFDDVLGGFGARGRADDRGAGRRRGGQTGRRLRGGRHDRRAHRLPRARRGRRGGARGRRIAAARGWSASRAMRRRSVTTSRPTRWPASPATYRRCAPRWCGWPRCSRRTE